MNIKKILLNTISLLLLPAMLTSCARDLGSDVYTSNSTMSLTLEGTIISARPVKIKNSDKLEDNALGGIAGGVLGAALGSNIGGGGGRSVATAGGAIAGSGLGALVQDKLSTSQGIEYIVKIDQGQINNIRQHGNQASQDIIASSVSNGLITIVQAADKIMSAGQSVYIIYSGSRTRVIPR